MDAGSKMPSASRNFCKRGDGIAHGVFLALALGTVELLVVGERVRVGPDDVAVHQGRAVAGADVLHGAAQGGKACQQIGAVALSRWKFGKFATSG